MSEWAKTAFLVITLITVCVLNLSLTVALLRFLFSWEEKTGKGGKEMRKHPSMNWSYNPLSCLFIPFLWFISLSVWGLSCSVLAFVSLCSPQANEVNFVSLYQYLDTDFLLLLNNRNKSRSCERKRPTLVILTDVEGTSCTCISCKTCIEKDQSLPMSFRAVIPDFSCTFMMRMTYFMTD